MQSKERPEAGEGKRHSLELKAGSYLQKRAACIDSKMAAVYAPLEMLCLSRDDERGHEPSTR